MNGHRRQRNLEAPTVTGDLGHLAVACLAFVVGHVAVSSTPLRSMLAGALGERTYLALYSLLSAACLAWMIAAYGAAPHVELWTAGTGWRHLSFTVMGLVAVLLVTGIGGNNPSMVGAAAGSATGIIKVTRHPIMWAFALWALIHMAANGDVASLVFFGAFAVLALAGGPLIDRRKRAAMGGEWERLMNETSNVPFLAILGRRTALRRGDLGWGRMLAAGVLYAGFILLHEFVIGVSLLPG